MKYIMKYSEIKFSKLRKYQSFNYCVKARNLLTGGNRSSARQYYYVSKIARSKISTYRSDKNKGKDNTYNSFEF